MDALEAQQQPSGGNGQAPAARKCGEKQKKPFASRQEAEQFEVENRKRFPNVGRQYAYQCLECPDYHLTSKPPDAYAMGQTNLKRLEGLAMEATSKTSGKRGRRGETEAEVKELWTLGLSDTDIASQLGVSKQTVYHHRKKFGAAHQRAEHSSPIRQLKPPLTLSEVDEQKRLLEQEYQSKLMQIEQQKQRLVEANRVTVCECQDGRALLVKFGQHEHMVVPKEKIEELTDCLLRWI
jgi:transposase